MDAEELRAFLPLLDLTHQSHVLEVGCGSGGCARYPSRLTHAHVSGIDANASAIEEARFEQIDAIERVPLENASFDAVFSNEQLVTRSSIELYLFLPPGENEGLIRQGGFDLLASVDSTSNAAAISKRWHDARAPV